MARYRHLFFDLDNTLWDFQRNSDAVLDALYEEHALGERGVPNSVAFKERYHVHNEQAWKSYREGRTDAQRLRWERYHRTLDDFGCRDRNLALQLSAAYLENLAQQAHLIEGTEALVQALLPRYVLHIITNGFEEVQQGKMKRSGLDAHFQTLTAADTAGATKPDPRIFEHALKQAGAEPGESLYVGDHPEVDGASEALGIAFAWFNPKRSPNHYGHTRDLEKLEDLLLHLVE
jgi:putative hydrolase of the HAD superfamily